MDELAQSGSTLVPASTTSLASNRDGMVDSSADWIIECQDLTKRFGDSDALVDCNLRVPSRSIVGLLGPNGAGKTTLLRTLLGFQRPTSGSARICQFDCVTESLKVREQVAYLPGDARLFRTMTGRAVLELFAGLSPYGDLLRSRAVADRLELELKRRVMFMSTGMRQKLALSIVLGSGAPLVILDEPTANLDPNVRCEVIAMVREIRDSGRTVLMSSHIFSDIEDTCDEVVILRAGRLVHSQRLADLARLHVIQAQIRGPRNELENVLKSEAFVAFHQGNGRDIEIHLTGQPSLWLHWLAELPLDELRIERASVSAIYQRFHRS